MINTYNIVASNNRLWHLENTVNKVTISSVFYHTIRSIVIENNHRYSYPADFLLNPFLSSQLGFFSQI